MFSNSCSVVDMIVDDVYSLASIEYFRKLVSSIQNRMNCDYVGLYIASNGLELPLNSYTVHKNNESLVFDVLMSSGMIDFLSAKNGYFSIKDLKNSELYNDDLICGLDAVLLQSITIKDSSDYFLGFLVVIESNNKKTDEIFINLMKLQSDRLRLEIQNELLKKQVLKNNDDYLEFLDMSRDCILEIDTRGVILNANKSSGDIYHYAPSEMIGKNITDFMLSSYSCEFFEHLQMVISGSDVHNMMAEYLTKGGSVIQIMYSIKKKLNNAGECVAATCFTTDVTESIEARTMMQNNSEIFSEILARLPVVFFRMDKDGVIVDIRGNGLKRMGVEDMDWVGNPGYGLFLGMDKLIDLSLSGETVSFESRGTFQGAPWWFHVSMFFDCWVGSGTLGFAVDITEQKIGERKLVELLKQNRSLAQKLIVVQEEERRNLSRELHDELGQSITAVKSLAKAITASAGDTYSESRSLGNSIIDISAHLYDVVSNIMQRLRPDVLDSLGFRAMINCCIAQSHLEKTGVNCDVDYIGDLDDIDETIQITIYRIVQECLTNISKHSMASNVSISIERKMMKYLDRRFATDDRIGVDRALNYLERNILHIIISDDGVGMDLLDPKKAVSSGTGMGLQGMKERVMAVGGFINFESEHNNGLTIKVVLDLKTKILGEYSNGLFSETTSSSQNNVINEAKKNLVN